MATINLGNIKFNWQGTYNAGTTYAVDDVVAYNGSSYVCILASTGNLPTNTTYWNVMSQAGTDGTDGTDVGTTLTTQGDMLYRDGSGLQRLAKGTAGQVLKINSGATAPEWGSDEGGGMDLLYSTDSVSTSVFNIDNVFSGTYKIYKIFMVDLVPSNNAELQFNFRTGGSSGAISNTANYRWTGIRQERNSGGNDSVSSANHDWGITYGRLAQESVANNDAKAFNSEMTLWNPYANNRTWWRAFTSCTDSSGAYVVGYDNNGYYDLDAVVTGIAINCSSGSWSTGSIRIFGIKGS